MKLELIATATFGLEAVVKREIQNLGYKIIKTEDGKVTYMGDERAIVRSNLWLRSADRVLLKVAEFNAPQFEDLYQQTKGLNWEELIPIDGKFTVTCTTVKSKLHSEPAIQKTVKKAIVEKLSEFYNVEHFDETGASFTLIPLSPQIYSPSIFSRKNVQSIFLSGILIGLTAANNSNSLLRRLLALTKLGRPSPALGVVIGPFTSTSHSFIWGITSLGRLSILATRFSIVIPSISRISILPL